MIDAVRTGACKLSLKPDHAIVNEYEPGQGISARVDCVPCYDDTIAILSLGSSAVMQFINCNEMQESYLEPRRLIVLSGEARFRWMHAIPARKPDMVGGFKIERKRRVSLTFRKII
jgi:alkylated DNA repair dioxygenase AlkB